MLLTVEDFRHRTQNNLADLIRELQLLTGRTGEEEARAWRASLPKLADVLRSPSLGSLHLDLSGNGYLAVEYQLPAAASWCDVVLLGRNDARPAAVVIELKDWETFGDRPGSHEGLMIRHGNVELHPSEQVRGYVEYCQRFHSGVQVHAARVSGCVMFTRGRFADAYAESPNDWLASEYPLFTAMPHIVEEVFPRYIADQIPSADEQFARDFVEGKYQQDRGFIRQIGQQIRDARSSPFVLLDHQRRAFAMVRDRLEHTVLGRGGPKKQVVLIEGPPGSGKSVLAANIWASLVTDERLPEGSAVLATTSTSQFSNWTSLFRKAGGNRAAEGVIKTAGRFMPLSPAQVGSERTRRGKPFLADTSRWRENVQLVRNLGIPFQDGARDDQHVVTIVDEAHALINPEHPTGRGNFGFAPGLGPQAWHIIRASQVAIFLLDAEQGFRDRENTTRADLVRWAQELGAEVHGPISLAGAQFRCGGSVAFVDWVEGLLAGQPEDALRPLARQWKRQLDVQIHATPADLEDAVRTRMSDRSANGRLLASYARPWATKRAAKPHDLPPHMQDFHIPYTANGVRKHWSRPWNFVPRGSDYTWFVQARPGSPISGDPLCEVGCPYAVRGFDFDHVGVLWLSDLVYRSGQWAVDLKHVHESGLDRSLGAAKRETVGDVAREQLRSAIAQAYRILLTRGLSSLDLWFEDAETRDHVVQCMG